MNKFIKIINVPSGLVGVFEDDGETGYFYSYSPGENKILLDLIIYQRENGSFEPSENDIKFGLDNNSNQIGVYVWDKLRGYIIFPDKKRERLKFTSPDSPGISHSVLPEEYQSLVNKPDQIVTSESDATEFIETRKKYWKDIADKLKI